MKDAEATTKTLPAVVGVAISPPDDIAEYFHQSANACEAMLSWAMRNHIESPTELQRALKSVDLYCNIRTKIADMHRSSVSQSESWDPFGEDPMDSAVAEAEAVGHLASVKQEAKLMKKKVKDVG